MRMPWLVILTPVIAALACRHADPTYVKSTKKDRPQHTPPLPSPPTPSPHSYRHKAWHGVTSFLGAMGQGPGGWEKTRVVVARPWAQAHVLARALALVLAWARPRPWPGPWPWPGIHESMDPSIHPWIHGSIDPWIHGSKELWIRGSVDPWIHGSMDPRIHGSIYPPNGIFYPWVRWDGDLADFRRCSRDGACAVGVFLRLLCFS